MKQTLLIDVDGVLADFVRVWLDVAKEVSGTSFEPKDVRDWAFKSLGLTPEQYQEVWNRLEAVDVTSFPLIDESLTYKLAIAEKQLGFDIYYVTTPMPKNHRWHAGRLAWLEKHFNAEPRQVIFTHDKGLIHGDVLIEDNLVNALHWAHYHPQGRAMVIEKPYFDRPIYSPPNLEFYPSTEDAILSLRSTLGRLTPKWTPVPKVPEKEAAPRAPEVKEQQKTVRVVSVQKEKRSPGTVIRREVPQKEKRKIPPVAPLERPPEPAKKPKPKPRYDKKSAKRNGLQKLK